MPAVPADVAPKAKSSLKSGFLNTNETLIDADQSDDMPPEYQASTKELDMLMFTHADKNQDGLLSPLEYVSYRCAEQLPSSARAPRMA